MSRNKKNTTFRFPFDIDTRVFLALAAFFFILSIKQINQPLLSNVSLEHVQQKLQKYANSQIVHFNHVLLSNQIAEAYRGHVEEEDF
jgi:hypothetical protein